MKLRESGMPERDYWESLFKPADFITELDITSSVVDMAEFGCGYGTFTLPIAEIISGQVFAMDLDPEMLKATYERALENNIENITLLQCDFLDEGVQLSSESVDGAFIAHILHGSEDENLELLREAFRILKPNGLLFLLHWRADVDTPRGPPYEMRLRAESAIELAQTAGFIGPSNSMILGDYHWGARIRKPMGC